ncbi:MAG: flavodoxin family protein [Eubacteriaceae bacterium]|nr:flavodoxin family protein [Eubacteriaceae bacterium]
MQKKIVSINCSPRTGWNTDILVSEAEKGAAANGGEIERFDLYKLGPFTGCLSCFGCKTEKYQGKCVTNDALSPVLESIQKADGLIIGTPIYISEVTAGFRAFYERLAFQTITYREDIHSYNNRKIPVVLIFTCNASKSAFAHAGYEKLLGKYSEEMGRFVGPTSVFVASETMQVDNYEKWGWTRFDAKEREERRRNVFPVEMEEAYNLGFNVAG